MTTVTIPLDPPRCTSYRLGGSLGTARLDTARVTIGATGWTVECDGRRTRMDGAQGGAIHMSWTEADDAQCQFYAPWVLALVEQARAEQGRAAA